MIIVQPLSHALSVTFHSKNSNLRHKLLICRRFSTTIYNREVLERPRMFLSPFCRTICFAVRFGRNVVELMLLLLILSSNNKQAAKVAAKSKYFLGSNYRTSEAIKPKSAATLFTIAATFYSIIIEQIFATQTKPYKKIHILFIFLEMLTSFSSLL